ncbi:transcription antitermination factor NusB [Thermophilibacter mediterraneus]|uniref:transcription antitermination factor NusB n=1 Tax=Thermophilibacter mediterraneus TaxID=1871031 RepID=UPI0032081310
MSTHIGGRTLARSQALQLLFQAEANSRAVLSVLDGDYVLWDAEPLDDYARRLALGADEMRPDLDAIISVRSTGWSLGRLNAVDRNLLRLALYEMLCVDDVDLAVTINECVELAKAYGTDESSRFVNGVLGRVSDDIEAGVDVIAAAREAARERAGAEGDAESPAPDGSADDEAE